LIILPKTNEVLKMKLPRKFLTIMAFTDDGKCFNYKIPIIFIKFFIFFQIILFVAGGVSAYLLKKYLPKKDYIKKLEKENKYLHAQVNEFTDKINKLKAEVDKLNNLTTKLRIMANLSINDNNNKDEGIGGPSFEEVKNFIDLNTIEDENIQKIHYALDRLKYELSQEDKSIQQLFKYLKEKNIKLSCTPSIIPAEGWISSGFGYRRDPFTGRKRFHPGIDISNRIGTPVVAPADGIVIFTGRKGGYGKCIIISHGYGITTRYGHLHKIFVKVGQKVQRGDIIGEIGSTGRSTGPHLHYEVRLYNKPVNPLNYILN